MSASSLRGTFAPHRCRPATRCYFLLSLLLSCPPPPCEQRHPVRRTSARVTTAVHRRGLGTYMDEPLERVARRELSERFEPGRELARLTRPPRSCSPPACSGGSDCPPSTSVVASVVVDVIAPSSIRVRVPKQQSRQGYQLALPAKPTQPAHGAMRSAMSRVFKEQHGCCCEARQRSPRPRARERFGLCATSKSRWDQLVMTTSTTKFVLSSPCPRQDRQGRTWREHPTASSKRPA
jgi:hypothetical protein